jgi:hypothetical protein
MLIILCHAGDAPALWVHAALRGVGVAAELVTVEQLVFSRRIVHRLDDDGDRGAIHLADGRVLRPEALAGVLNRVHYLPTQHFAAATPADRAYATEELGAFLLAWLDGVAGPVINPPLPSAIDGGTFDPMTLAHLAATAGLPVPAWTAGTRGERDDESPERPCTHAAIVFGGRVFGPVLPRPWQDGGVRLAVSLGVPLLEVRLERSTEGHWRFVTASGLVDFRHGGRPLVAALRQAFIARGTPA